MTIIFKWCLIIGISFAFLISIILVIVCKRKNSSKKTLQFSGLLDALGGSSNISNICLNGSRISLNFEDKNFIDKNLIKDNGVDSIVVSNKKITLVIGKKAEAVYKYLKENMN